MTQSPRQNIYNLLKREFKIFDILIDVGCKGFYDLIDFENSEFKNLIGISKEFERGNAFGDYRERKTENLGLTNEEWSNMSGGLFNIFKERFQIITGDLFDFDFGLDKNSLIICNKLLHFFNDKTKFELIEKFHNSLEKDGLLYLKINHFKHPNNTDLTKLTKIDETTYQNKEVPEDIRYLIVPEKFLFTLKKSYNLLTDYVLQDNKALGVVIRK